jgi:hypothetical protein
MLLRSRRLDLQIWPPFCPSKLYAGGVPVGFNENALGLGRLSYSKIRVAKKCAFQFRKRYIEHEKPTNDVDLTRSVVGIAVHAVFEKVMETYAESPMEPSFEVVRALVDDAIAGVCQTHDVTESEGLEILASQASMEALLLRILTFVFDKKCKVYVEREFALDSDLQPIPTTSEKIFFGGKVDLVLVQPSGQVAIPDYKNSNFYGPKTMLSHVDQLRAYTVLVHQALSPLVLQEHGIKTSAYQTGIVFLKDQHIEWTRPAVTARQVSTEVIPQFMKWVNELADAGVEGKITRGNHCMDCGYRSFCGSKRGMKKATASLDQPVLL